MKILYPVLCIITLLKVSYGLYGMEGLPTLISSSARPERGRFFEGTPIEATTLAGLLPEASKEAQEFVAENSEFFRRLTAMPAKMSDLANPEVRKEIAETNDALLASMRLANLGKLSYVVPSGKHVYRVAGLINKIWAVKAANNLYSTPLADVADKLVIPEHTYQGPSSAAYFLLAKQAQAGTLGIKVPETSLVGLSEGALQHPDDTNCVVVQEYIPGNLQKITVQTSGSISDAQVANMAKLTIDATLWDGDSWRLRAEDNAIAMLCPGHPNNSHPDDFLNGWTPRHPAHPTHPSFKLRHNTAEGLKGLATLFKGNARKVGIIQEVARQEGFIADYRESSGDADHNALIKAFEDGKK